MIIFWRLLLSHLLADFTLQFDVINRLKRRHVWGMLMHCATHVVVSVALTWEFLPDTWFRLGGLQFNGWAALAVMFLLHFLVDQLRVYAMRSLGMKDSAASFIIDQVLHVYVLFLISPVSAHDPGLLLGEKWSAIACMLVLVAHFSTVLIYYVEKELYGKGFPGFDEKYFLIFERIVILCFFFVPGIWWIPLLAAWVIQLLYIKHKRVMDLSGVNVFLSVLIPVLAGLWTRFVYYGRL